jgi:hypothetical protein
VVGAVLGPQGIPIITDPILAIAEPELALLSALSHARHENEVAFAVTQAALFGIASVPAEQQVVYFHLLRSAVGTAARKAFAMLPHRLEKYLTDEERQRMRNAHSEGRVEGLSFAVLKVLESRNVALSQSVREAILAKPEPELAHMLGRAALVESAEELLD